MESRSETRIEPSSSTPKARISGADRSTVLRKATWIELSLSGAETGIVLFTPDGQEDRIGTFVNTSWEVDDVEKTYTELQKKGVEFAGPPEKQPWGTFVIVKDSEGNQIVLSAR